MKRITALLLALMMILALAGCGSAVDNEAWLLELQYRDLDLLKYSEMEYQRPDMTAHDATLEESCRIAAEETDSQKVLDAVYTYYDEYYWFQTNYALANIRYSKDLTDIYWEQEYDFCAEKASELDAGLDRLYHALAKSPVREELENAFFGQGFFDAYDGESIWDETFTAMMEEEAKLISRYYDLSAQATEAEALDWLPMGELLAELVLLRQRIAQYAGYDSYSRFAYEFYYYRDYTPEQVEAYLQQIRTELVPMYVNTDQKVWNAGYQSCTEQDAFAYLKSCAQTMGGTLQGAFKMLERYELYDIAYSGKKFNASFETFLSYYCEPFLFMNPQGTQADKLTLVHEFGHFANDYACFGSYAGIDVAEVYSQALEYLSLIYGPNGDALREYKMAESLCVFVEQAAYADFENRLYAMEPKAVTAQNIRNLFQQVGTEYGFDTWGFDSRLFTQITHFYTNPQYVISYVTSNDAAFQIYQMELAQERAGLELYQDSLDSQMESFLLFLEEQGLESPFAEGRVAKIRQTLDEILN